MKCRQKATQPYFSQNKQLSLQPFNQQETKAFLCDQLRVIPNVSQLVLSDRGHGNNNNNAVLWRDSGIRQIPDRVKWQISLALWKAWVVHTNCEPVRPNHSASGTIVFHGPAEDTCATSRGGRVCVGGRVSVISSKSVFLSTSPSMITRKDLSPGLLLFDPWRGNSKTTNCCYACLSHDEQYREESPPKASQPARGGGVGW